MSELNVVETRPPGVNAESAPRPERPPYVVIQPARGWHLMAWRELWSYRDLLWLLAGRDVKLRYKQTALGLIWVVLQPLVAALIFAVIFGHFGKLPSDGSPYVLFVFAGLMPWNYFAGALQRAGNSLVVDSNLIRRVYFPREILPLASTAAMLIDFAVTLAVFFALMLIYQVPLTWRLLALPAFLLLNTIMALGASLWLSALNVQYRDFMYALPFLLQVWMYASPVVYATSIIPKAWQGLFSLNPAVGFIEGFRWSLLGTGTLDLTMLFAACVVGLLTLVSG